MISLPSFLLIKHPRSLKSPLEPQRVASVRKHMQQHESTTRGAQKRQRCPMDISLSVAALMRLHVWYLPSFLNVRPEGVWIKHQPAHSSSSSAQLSRPWASPRTDLYPHWESERCHLKPTFSSTDPLTAVPMSHFTLQTKKETLTPTHLDGTLHKYINKCVCSLNANKLIFAYIWLMINRPCVSKYRMFSVMMSNDGQHGQNSQSSLPLSGLRQQCMLAQRELTVNHGHSPAPLYCYDSNARIRWHLCSAMWDVSLMVKRM